MSANTCRQACVGLSAAADDGDSSPPLAACFFYVHLTLFLFSFLCRDYDYDDDLSIFAVGGMVEQMRKSREKDAPREDIAVMPRRNQPRSGALPIEPPTTTTTTSPPRAVRSQFD